MPDMQMGVLATFMLGAPFTTIGGYIMYMSAQNERCTHEPTMTWDNFKVLLHSASPTRHSKFIFMHFKTATDDMLHVIYTAVTHTGSSGARP